MQVVDEFAVRVYRWALADAARELREDFPLLRLGARNGWQMGQEQLDFALSLPPGERGTFLAASVKLASQRALAILGESPSASEGPLWRAYRQTRTSSASGTLAWLDLPSDRRRSLRKQLRGALEAEARRLFGGTRESWGGGEVRHTKPCGDWSVGVWLDFGGVEMFSYGHFINATQALPFQPHVYGPITIQSQMTWDPVAEERMDDQVAAIGQFWAHFLQAAPDWLRGLSREQYLAECEAQSPPPPAEA